MDKEEKYIKFQVSILGKLLNLEKLPSNAKENLVEYLTFRNELTRESDRGSALLAASYIDALLEKVLKVKMIGNKKHLENLFDANGPLGSFSSRINIAYSVGLITKNHHNDLHLIRKIRNVFGHSPSIIGFSDERIASQCKSLKCVTRENALRPRQIFNTSVSFLVGTLESLVISERKFEEPAEDFIEDVKKAMRFYDEALDVLLGNKE